MQNLERITVLDAKWTRRPFQYKRSANRRREYARGGAQSKIVRYWGGNKSIPWVDWDLVVGLKVDKQVQISSNALEAIRITINSALQKSLGRNNFRFRIRPKPFQKYSHNRTLQQINRQGTGYHIVLLTIPTHNDSNSNLGAPHHTSQNNSSN